jgi:hypothetical protein
MARDPANSAKSIERLLEERQKIEQWLDRLGTAADQTPGHVKQRVESDYKRRLDEVVAELHGYKDELTSALERHRSTRGALAGEEREASERLAEAELRHTVGEFDDEHWSVMKAEILESLAKTREQLRSVDGEIGGLEEVVTLIEAGPAKSKSAAAPLRDAPDEIDAALDAVGIESNAAGRRYPAADDAVDELEFLRSVTEDEAQGPAPSRASGQIRMPEEVAAELHSARDSSREPAQPAADEIVISRDVPTEPTKAAAKTLKCDECGTMNLPTEWYCERCGAELAAL